jgi:mono/diheme cytochrome c family protein
VFTTTTSMWMGIAFLLLAIAAVTLQAWLWGPRWWDAEHRRTTAPPAWLRVHAMCGYGYGLIYLVMMWNMVPRLWEYQYELPARTVIHAVVAIVIGVLLITKVAILRWFRHFEEAMPRYGMGILVCTVVLVVLSVPYAVRAHDLGGQATSPENLARVEQRLAEIEFEVAVDRGQLATAEGLERGRAVLVGKCTACHDMRTILVQPRTAGAWHELNLRMLEKPAVYGQRLSADDVPWVTAYLVAITPDIQRSVKRRRAEQHERRELGEAMGVALHEADDSVGTPTGARDGEEILSRRCVDCHGLEEVESYGGADASGWRSVVAAMVEEGAEIGDDEAVQLAAWLAATHPPLAGEPVPATPAPTPPQVEPPDPAPVVAPEPAPAPRPRKKRAAGSPDLEDPFRPSSEAEAEAEPAPEPARGPDAAAGRALFLARCKSCHGPDGKGDSPYGEKIGVPDLTAVSASDDAVRATIRDGRSGTKMRGYGKRLDAAALEDLVAFVQSL